MQVTTHLLTGPLCVENVGVTLGGNRILHGIDLTLHPGEMCALIGPSGVGKRTLIRALLGLREPEDGLVRVGSTPVAEVGPVGYVPQDDALHRGLTVRRELAYTAELRMPETSVDERDARIAEVLDQVGLTTQTGLDVGAGRVRQDRRFLGGGAQLLGHVETQVGVSWHGRPRPSAGRGAP